MPHTLGGDLIRLLATQAVHTGGQALLAPLTARVQADRLQRMEEAKNLWGMAGEASSQDEKLAIDRRLRELTGRGLPVVGGTQASAPATGPLGGTVLPRLLGRGSTPTEAPGPQTQFLVPPRSLDQHMAAIYNQLPPEIKQQYLAYRLKGEMTPGEQVAKILQAQKQDTTEKHQDATLAETQRWHDMEAKHQQVQEETQRLVVAMHADSQKALAQHRSDMLKFFMSKEDDMNKKAAYAKLIDLNEAYQKLDATSKNMTEKVRAADAVNLGIKQFEEKWGSSNITPINVGEVDINHYWNKYGLGTGPAVTKERQIVKPEQSTSKPSGESAEAGEKPKAKPKSEGFRLWNKETNSWENVDEATYNAVKGRK